MKKSMVVAALAGLVAAVLLVVYRGVAEVFGPLVDTGWGLLLITLFHAVPLVLSAKGLQVLIIGHRTGLLQVTHLRWIREGINNLLPVAQVGGDFIGARLLTFFGIPGGLAGGSAVVSLTMEVLTQFLFTVLGFGLLLLVLGGRESEGLSWILFGLLTALPVLLGFVVAQRTGLFRLVERLFNRITKGLDLEWLGIGELSGLHDAIQTIYRSPRALISSALYHFFSWVIGAGEVWIALYFMGYPVSIWDALILESLGKAVRSAAFIVPGGLGVQEGGFMLLAPLLGLTPEVGLALSLAKRVREVALGAPSLFAWHVVEGRRLWQRRKPS
ncbi:MAG: flippase-like domain-containing protein [Alphaproteobacteria bacterium]|nr:flippase-like domain-containing protein [Alphaproteobacteria bacterium]